MRSRLLEQLEPRELLHSIQDDEAMRFAATPVIVRAPKAEFSLEGRCAEEDVSGPAPIYEQRPPLNRGRFLPFQRVAVDAWGEEGALTSWGGGWSGGLGAAAAVLWGRGVRRSVSCYLVVLAKK